MIKHLELKNEIMKYAPNALEFWKWYDSKDYKSFNDEDLRLLNHMLNFINQYFHTRITLQYYLY